MKILFVGNDPGEIGGVSNYTRPLSITMKNLGHEVYYLYSGADHCRYNLFFKPYLKIYRNMFPFECAEIINSINFPYNYGYPELDIASRGMDKEITKYIVRIKPDIIHIHSRLGLPASINEIGQRYGAVVLNTIHVYGYICQKRVMIDYDGNPCLGPDDLVKCAICTGTFDYKKERLNRMAINLKKYIKEKYPSLPKKLEGIRGKKKNRGELFPAKDNGREFQGKRYKNVTSIAEGLKRRLAYCVDVLNRYSDCTICVSSDVRNTLMRYGIEGHKLMVQHIGSTIAEKQTVNMREPADPLVIGNIGGVNYYKGTHVLIDALAKVRNKNFVVKIFGKYQAEYIDSLRARSKGFPVEFTGRYRPEDLPEILRQIDIMVLPSICNDTAPQTIFESFSGGVPIIASNIGGFPDFVRHGLNGFLFDPGNSDDLANKIDLVLDAPGRIKDFRENVPKLKTIPDDVKELIELYSSLLALRHKGHNPATG